MTAPVKKSGFFLNGTLAWAVSGDRDCRKCLDIDPDTLYQLENVGEVECCRKRKELVWYQLFMEKQVIPQRLFFYKNVGLYDKMPYKN